MSVSVHPHAAHDEIPELRTISMSDLRDALAKGADDYKHSWPVSLPLALCFSLIGLFLLEAVRGAQFLQLLFPMISGFALLGPIACVGFYQYSRLREANRPIRPTHLLAIGWKRFRNILFLSVILLAVFSLWLLLADSVYTWAVNGDIAPTEVHFWKQLGDPSVIGRLVGLGGVVGFFIAVLVFSMSVISFPLLLDRDVGAAVAMGLSVKAVVENPLVMAKWAAFIAVSLLMGFIPMLLGLSVALPLLGHASWHLYRKVVLR